MLASLRRGVVGGEHGLPRLGGRRRRFAVLLDGQRRRGLRNRATVSLGQTWSGEWAEPPVPLRGASRGRDHGGVSLEASVAASLGGPRQRHCH